VKNGFENSLKDKTTNLVLALDEVVSQYNKISLSSSLSAEDMVLTHIVSTRNYPIEIFSLDTGRLHEETYQLMSEVQSKYNNQLKIYFPESKDLESFMNNQGPNSFYQSIDFRKLCCHIRKVEPLKRALRNREVWITGLRHEQSVTRQAVDAFCWDDSFKIYKFNPLLDWSHEDVWQFIKENKVPYNALHDKGFPSIGCSPCTRAVSSGENERAGRWWWESPETKECGLHVAAVSNKQPHGKIVA